MVTAGSFFAEQGLLRFVSVSSLATRISSSHLSHSFPGFDLLHMGYPLRDLPISRVVPFLAIPECVSLGMGMETLLIVRVRDCHCRLAVTLCFHRDSLAFNVSCLNPCDSYPILNYLQDCCTLLSLVGCCTNVCDSCYPYRLVANHGVENTFNLLCRKLYSLHSLQI